MKLDSRFSVAKQTSSCCPHLAASPKNHATGFRIETDTATLDMVVYLLQHTGFCCCSLYRRIWFERGYQLQVSCFSVYCLILLLVPPHKSIIPHNILKIQVLHTEPAFLVNNPSATISSHTYPCGVSSSPPRHSQVHVFQERPYRNGVGDEHTVQPRKGHARCSSMAPTPFC